MAADFVLRIIYALLTDFDTVCVGFATPIVSGHQQFISSLDLVTSCEESSQFSE